MPNVHCPVRLARLAVLAAALLLAAPPAWAGCGCDHPPPAWADVMPPFGSRGRMITLMADGLALEIGAAYDVAFGDERTEQVEALRTDRLEVKLPSLTPGPVEIRVTGPGVDVTYPDTLFTALPRARRIKERIGVFTARHYDAAVGADGTFYLAVDVSRVEDAMQFTFALHGLPLHFEAEDVVIYNADGVDLSLFTLSVDDPTARQWGSYYGWSVETDHGIVTDHYRPQTDDSDDPLDQAALSSIFTYWRHEFSTYAAAHEPGGSHEVDAQGLHPDGTLHVDHDRLIIAIQGVERDASDPLDLSKATPLAPGRRETKVGWLSVPTPQPIELPELVPFVSDELEDFLEELEEVLDL